MTNPTPETTPTVDAPALVVPPDTAPDDGSTVEPPDVAETPTDDTHAQNPSGEPSDPTPPSDPAGVLTDATVTPAPVDAPAPEDPAAATPAPAQPDPNVAAFNAGTAHSTSETPPEPPETATGDNIATDHRDSTSDASVVENVPAPPPDLPAEWGALRGEVTQILAKLSELHDLVMEVAPSVRKVTKDVEQGGLSALFAGMFGRKG